MKILLVDDDPKDLLAMRALLEDLGAAIHCARSGEEALRQMLKHRYAAIVLDVCMPGIDGFEAARRRGPPAPRRRVSRVAGARRSPVSRRARCRCITTARQYDTTVK